MNRPAVKIILTLHNHVTNKVDAPLFPMYERELFCHYHLVSQYPHCHSGAYHLYIKAVPRGPIQWDVILWLHSSYPSPLLLWSTGSVRRLYSNFSTLNQTRSLHLCFHFRDDQWMSPLVLKYCSLYYRILLLAYQSRIPWVVIISPFWLLPLLLSLNNAIPTRSIYSLVVCSYIPSILYCLDMLIWKPCLCSSGSLPLDLSPRIAILTKLQLLPIHPLNSCHKAILQGTQSTINRYAHLQQCMTSVANLTQLFETGISCVLILAPIICCYIC